MHLCEDRTIFGLGMAELKTMFIRVLLDGVYLKRLDDEGVTWAKLGEECVPQAGAFLGAHALDVSWEGVHALDDFREVFTFHITLVCILVLGWFTSQTN